VRPSVNLTGRRTSADLAFACIFNRELGKQQ
jgi:hypothetical protein